MRPSLKVLGPWALQAVGNRPEQEHPELPLRIPAASLQYQDTWNCPRCPWNYQEIRKCWSCRCGTAEDADPSAAGFPPSSCSTTHFSCSQASVEPVANAPAWADPRETGAASPIPNRAEPCGATGKGFPLQSITPELSNSPIPRSPCGTSGALPRESKINQSWHHQLMPPRAIGTALVSQQ